jgi:hypothetical protein
MRSRRVPERRRCQCWLLPALALLGFLSVSSLQAQGTIIYVHLPPTEPEVFPYDANGLRLLGEFPMSYDLVFSGQVAFTLNSGNAFSITPSSLDGVIAVHSSPNDLGGLVIPLNYGQQIGPDALGYEWVNDGVGSAFTACRDIGCIGYFTGVESAYGGLRFQQGGQTYYGWVRVGAPLAGFNGGWIYDYAYETVPDTPIFAGQGVPEPSSASLCILAIIAACLCQKRIRPDHRP